MRRTGPGIVCAAVAAALVLMGPAPAAHADDASYSLKIVKPKGKAGKAQGEAGEAGDSGGAAGGAGALPSLRAILSGRPGLTVKDFALKQSDAPPPAQPIAATRSVTYKDSDEPMALVVLVQGNFRWMGNETYTDSSDPEGGAVYDGAYKGLSPAIDSLAKAGPSGSKAALLVYAEGKVLVKQAMGDAGSLSGGALGSQQDYGEYISKPFVLGLDESWKLLANQPGYRKVLVVFGDGQDDKEDVSSELKKAVSNLKESGVEVYTVFYSAMPEDGPQGQQNMAKVGFSQHLTATSRDNFSSLADSIVEAIGAKYYVNFPGDKIAWDGAEHEFVLSVGGEDREPVNLTLPKIVVKKEESGSLWWVWLLVAAAVLLLIIIIIVVKRRQPVMEEQPLPIAPPVPAAPMKTIMLGVGGNEDAMPIVGWVVPLVGPNQYQTFKLLQGATRLGSGGESHIIVGDSFMSNRARRESSARPAASCSTIWARPTAPTSTAGR